MGKHGGAVLGAFLASMALVGCPVSARAQSGSGDEAPSAPVSLWKNDIGEGYRRGAKELDIAAGIGLGMKVLQSVGVHDWGIGLVDYGWVFTDVVGDGHWYRGNWELLGELFGGYQYRPEGAYFVGAGPHIRYNFATGCHLLPFIDLGAGVTATDIREPDLSTTFEFNLQGGVGVHYFLRDNLALTGQWRFIHFSNAGIKYTNLGVNSSTFLFGVSWFF